MRAIVKALIPAPVRQRLRLARKSVRYAYRKARIRGAVRRNAPLKIIVGAAETWRPGWYSTNEQWLDITSAKDWEETFAGRPLLTHVVAEHVFEHLTHDEAAQALRLIARHLQPGGRIRIAVPDGFHPDPTYIRHVGIGGIGDDAADHKQLLNADVLRGLITDAGFKATLVEGFERDGRLVQTPWREEDGYVWRSRQNPSTAVFDFVDAETSLIVDGVLA
ncbi:hypothetical protein [Brevundimonas sp.]|uniref:hypothetical protein n=1 Tax=Brevundimonas sp. TaxID=1871086 RepID=UPI002FD9630A